MIFIGIFYSLKIPKKQNKIGKGDFYINCLKLKIVLFALLITVAMFIFTSAIRVSGVEIQKLAKESVNTKVCITNVKTLNEEELFKNENWILEIPKIGLKANINYGTTKEVMDKYIGHFDNTSFWDGNIGLAAHNRGYPVNYFGRLKELQIGDEINYTTVFGTKNYKVETITVIADTDWSYLEETNENKITLITCVENQPNYRRCIQGVEI